MLTSKTEVSSRKASLTSRSATKPCSTSVRIRSSVGAPFKPITVPVLVIHGMKDTALNAAGHSGTGDYVTADTTILMIPNAGHWVQHDAQALVDRTVHDWLDARR
jgi:pimeloyl-ACP methyl ester carboxylesterase